jgi:ParB-like chromosome segregation protein Spo0J
MSESETLKFHPLAEIFPLIEGAEFDDLVADNVNGLHEPIVVLDDLILDGRNRYRACLIAGVEPLFMPYRGDDPVSFVISRNLRRRHLDESQRATVAAKLATLQDGQRADLVEGLPIGRAAKLLKVGERSVARAREVLNHGAPELVTAVERGNVSVSAAADVATLPAAEQAEIVARGEREILLKAKEIRAKQVKQSYAARKPVEAYEMIERMYPDLPRIELFSRSPREGWVAWGNQAGDDPFEIPPMLRRTGGAP